MIGSLLPNVVAWAESRVDVPVSTMLPEEVEVVSRSVSKRKREFATVRHCARRALADLGIGPVPLLPGASGEPQWPPGIVGTMTHCTGYRAAAVASDPHVAALGIDAEPCEAMPPGVLRTISSAGERAHVGALAREHPEVPWDRLLFCAKEATYKAWFPLMHAWLGFEDARVTFDVNAMVFTSELLVAGPVVGGASIEAFLGRWSAGDDIVATAVAVMGER